MNDENDIIKRLAELEKMAESVENLGSEKTELSSDVDLAPIVTRINEEPAPVVPPQLTRSDDPASPAEQPVIEKKPSGIPLNPQVLEILEHTSGALDLIIMGIQAKVVRAGLNENTEQIGALSMVLAHVKNAKIKTDSLLG
jgi:hypothetical protein